MNVSRPDKSRILCQMTQVQLNIIKKNWYINIWGWGVGSPTDFNFQSQSQLITKNFLVQISTSKISKSIVKVTTRIGHCRQGHLYGIQLERRKFSLAFSYPKGKEKAKALYLE